MSKLYAIFVKLDIENIIKQKNPICDGKRFKLNFAIFNANEKKTEVSFVFDENGNQRFVNE